MQVFMAVTCDRYELPIAIGDNQKLLAKEMNVHEATVSKRLKKQRAGKKVKDIKIVKVEIEEDD